MTHLELVRKCLVLARVLHEDAPHATLKKKMSRWQANGVEPMGRPSMVIMQICAQLLLF